jgi:hypothetical protein
LTHLLAPAHIAHAIGQPDAEEEAQEAAHDSPESILLHCGLHHDIL